MENVIFCAVLGNQTHKNKNSGIVKLFKIFSKQWPILSKKLVINQHSLICFSILELIIVFAFGKQ